MTRKAWDTRVRHNAQRTDVGHRNRPVVMVLTVMTVALMAGGLFVDLQVGTRWLSVALYAAAAVSSIALLAFLYSKRLRIVRRPER